MGLEPSPPKLHFNAHPDSPALAGLFFYAGHPSACRFVTRSAPKERLADQYGPQEMIKDSAAPAGQSGTSRTSHLDACRHDGMTEQEEAELTDGQGGRSPTIKLRSLTPLMQSGVWRALSRQLASATLTLGRQPRRMPWNINSE
jgi:hypothetical protein